MYSCTAYIHVQCTVPSIHDCKDIACFCKGLLNFFCSEILVSDLKMYNLTSFCFAGTKIRIINLVLTVYHLKKSRIKITGEEKSLLKENTKRMCIIIFYIINALTCNWLQLCIDQFECLTPILPPSSLDTTPSIQLLFVPGE